MSLSVESLKGRGAFTGRPVKREISWEAGGETHTADVYIRRLSYQTTVTDLQALTAGADVGAHRIALCILDEEGKQVFQAHDIIGYYPDGSPVMDVDPETGEATPRGPMIGSLVMALLTAIGEVNDLGKLKTPTTD